LTTSGRRNLAAFVFFRIVLKVELIQNSDFKNVRMFLDDVFAENGFNVAGKLAQQTWMRTLFVRLEASGSFVVAVNEAGFGPVSSTGIFL